MAAVTGVAGVTSVSAVIAVIAVSAVGRLSPVALVARDVRLRMLIVRMVLVSHRPLLSLSPEPYTPQGYKGSPVEGFLHHTQTFGTSRWTPVPR